MRWPALESNCTIVRVEIVADKNVFLAVALYEPEKNRIIQMMVDALAMGPEILPYEIGNALSAIGNGNVGNVSGMNSGNASDEPEGSLP